MNIFPSAATRRVLMTADTVGGVWTYALELARSLLPSGVYFDIATMGAPLSVAQWEEALTLPNVRIHESQFKLEWMANPWEDVDAAGEWLLGLEGEVRPDVVHLNGFAHGSLPFRAPVLMVGHSCVLSWWEAVRGEPPPEEWETYKKIVRHGLHGAHIIAAPTQAMLTALDRHYGPFPITIKQRVLANGRDLAHFPQTSPENKENFILAAGRLWDDAKNIAALDSVAPSLPWPILVAGEDSTTASSSGSARRIGHLSQPELASFLGRAGIYALPARYEPFGLSILEAALSGCALVIGDIPSLREVWGSNSAIFVPPDDDAALRDILCYLINEPAERARLSSAARARALQYTRERMADAYRGVYAELSGAVRCPVGV